MLFAQKFAQLNPFRTLVAGIEWPLFKYINNKRIRPGSRSFSYPIILEDSIWSIYTLKRKKQKYVDTNSIARNFGYECANIAMDKSWRRLAVNMELPKGGTGLDVCCGTGMLTIEQAQAAGPAGKITGLDFSEHAGSCGKHKGP